MRAERLFAVLMLLKSHQRITAAQIAAELDVSVRTVLRDIDSLSVSGIPVYAERGRHGGFALLPGYRTDLTGLTSEEATSLLAGGDRLSSPAFGAALRKVAAALPEAHRERAMQAAQRVVVRPEGFVRSPPELSALGPVQQAVFDGRRLRVRYQRRGGVSSSRELDPIGLIAAGDLWYLVANSAGDERMYRVDRMSQVEVLDEPAQRAPEVDLDEIWQRHRASFRAAFESVDVVLDCATVDVDQFSGFGEVVAAGGLVTEALAAGTTRLRLRFGDRRHAVRSLWGASFGLAFTVIEPDWLRTELGERARAVAERHDG